MSYTLSPYLVDLDGLRRAVGGKDSALFKAVVDGNPAAFGEESDEEYDEDEEEISLRTALRQLIMAEPFAKDSLHQYGYALEQLCRHLGEEVVGRDLWSGIHWNVLEDTGVEEMLFQTGAPVSLPPSDDFPRIGHITATDIVAQLRRVGDAPLKTATPSGRKPRRSIRSWLFRLVFARLSRRDSLTAEERAELLDEYKSWLQEAAAKNRALVFFYY
jgi:hypothetical protein